MNAVKAASTQVRAQRVGPVHVTPDQHDDGDRVFACFGISEVLKATHNDDDLMTLFLSMP